MHRYCTSIKVSWIDNNNGHTPTKQLIFLSVAIVPHTWQLLGVPLSWIHLFNQIRINWCVLLPVTSLIKIQFETDLRIDKIIVWTTTRQSQTEKLENESYHILDSSKFTNKINVKWYMKCSIIVMIIAYLITKLMLSRHCTRD